MTHTNGTNGHHNGNGNGNGNGHLPARHRTNGLPVTPPRPMKVLVTGGGGYIGCIVIEHLLARGHDVRVLDRLYWGEGPLAKVRDRIELVLGDVRAIPEGTFDGVDAVIHLAGLSNDPTAEYDPEANWQMNAVATKAIGQACVAHGIERIVFASSCSLYDGLPPAMHDEQADIQPAGAYATSKRFGELSLLELQAEGLCPVILRNGTVYGWSPRMRFDLVVNTFVKDALLKHELTLHGGGWMWRPLVDIQDVADAMICVMEAPADLVRGEIFNVLHANYQIRELAMLVAGSVQLLGPQVRLREAPAPRLTRDYECTNAKLAGRLGFVPSRSVVDAVTSILGELDVDDPTAYTDPRYYNIRWLELLNELKPRLDALATVL